MGTTIRREPVNFDIPASPNYKFLNITNFRGLDVSSNPFELANNTASDCLNVYVDETNTLTTRPRLERKITQPMDGTHIATYNLHNGYLLHYLQDGEGVMRKLVAGVSTEITGTIPTVKCKYFEQGDKIYLLDRSRYMVIDDNNTLSDVEGYVPTTAVVDLNGVRHDVEPLNLLSDSYIETFFWDGQTNPISESVSVYPNHTKNKAIRNVKLDDYNDYSFILCFNDNTYLVKKDSVLYLGVPYNNYQEILFIDTGIVCSTEKITAARTSKDIMIIDDNNIFKVYKYLGNNMWSDAPLEYEHATFGDKIDASPNGKYVWEYDASLPWNLYWFEITEDSITSMGINGDPENDVLLHAWFDDTTDVKRYACLWQDKTNGINKRITYSDGITIGGFSAEFVLDGDNIGNLASDGKYYNYYTDGKKDIVYLVDFPQNGSSILNTYIYPKDFVTSFFMYSGKTKNFYWIDSSENNYLWMTSSEHPQDYYNTYAKINPNVLFNKDLDIIISESDTNIFDLYVWNKDSSQIQIELDVSVDVEAFNDWIEKRTQFFQSYLNTRFDNNYWFASKNRYYRSANNDPTYFPITEYNDLGDSNEEITGFNLANDTTLIAYKKNRVYLIQPFTSSLDTTEYAITESKNTVGNTAFGSPIVTTLTEIPLQINNDGIYGLSQLSNVSATERIADLMSEPINQRWLDVDDSVIERAITLNRLYWTYIILPYDTDTKIYLLDNRTNSWYYWELPIITSDAFVKDNHAEFVDSTGTIYYLTTTDIIDIAHEDEKVTKYYDDGERLIPWFWQSQILPMGTMNYSKRLVKTTFVLTDTDDSDGYGLQYNFRVFRKLASSTPEKEIVNKLTLVRSTTKKTNISKFGFLQIRLSNLTEAKRDYEAYENNKLRLVGLGLKYVLLEGLIA